ncbi:peptidoglycan-binding protein [Streptomyces sp. P17]|uniref:peptidoglycan-binding protein n=1 Tax=Streptomyces sp. P17 TaxID=3074716 RepID=UPI0028F42687|nr:peptidoglycan-binding protein [Streptomyces sp. P17]MDT9696995.1 peptidoglycan-binding protein [Streptomyces sp. P17]
MENNGPPLEPARVLRPRRTDALADLFREPDQDSGGYEPVPLPTPPHGSEADTQELPPVPGDTGRGPRRSGRPLPRAAVAIAVTAAALIGFGSALVLPPDEDDNAAPPPPAPSQPSTVSHVPDPDGPGTLREGDTGPEVTELKQRLLSVPDVYTSGSAGGRYDTTLTEAVARFQLWYGISGDETGVYGNDTRLALESRTPAFGD